MTPENQKRIDRLRKAIFRTGWTHPFFLIPSQRITFRIDPETPTASIDTKGIVRFGPNFLDGLKDPELAGVICHELMHALMGHARRRGLRDPQRWNKAADRAINQALVTSGIKLPSCALMPGVGQADWSAEQFYEVEPEAPEGGQPQPTAGCGQDQAEGDDPQEGEGAEGEDPGAPGKSPTSDDWREIAVQAAEVARGAGKSAGDALAKVLAEPPSKVRWRDVLRGACARAVAAHGYDDVSFRRLSRRSDEFLLPGPIAYRALVAVAVDTSGSVPDAALEVAIGEIVAISKLQPDVRFFLVTHDAIVQWQGWIQAGQRGGATIRGAMRGRGGTLFRPAYQAIEGTKKRFGAMVHLTDGAPCETWPAKPANVRRPVVALIGSAVRGMIPEGWRVVETERP